MFYDPFKTDFVALRMSGHGGDDVAFYTPKPDLP